MNTDPRPGPSPQDREAALFEIALEKTTAEREAFLQSVAAEDPALMLRLKALLAAHEQEDSILAAHAGPVPPALKTTVEKGRTGEAVGQTISRYKLLEKIGEGGFGVVYRAEQTEPLRREVALKIIKLGMDTREVVARFEAERQALALMDHPHIAKVLDGGATEAGRPYFVMELVRGVPLTAYCDEKALSTTERLQVFLQVCDGVEHAHQKGIIHRDLKPSNVLVTVHESRPIPKIIDFGVAKALGQKLTDKTIITGIAQLLGTPAYMSPEQAGLSGLDVDTRSDIYSLGVLLYELLTGVTPFDQQILARAAFDEMRRIISEGRPPKPSTRLQTLGNKLAEVARHRHTESAALSRLLRGELDWIVMKCLEKDRGRRYETTNALSCDIQRHLNAEPVLARPPSELYRLRKLIQRRKLAVAAFAATSLAFLVGTALSIWLFLQQWKAPIIQEWQQRLAQIVNVADQEEEASILRTRQLLRAVATSPSVQGGDRAACKRFLHDMCDSYPAYANLGVVDTNANLVTSVQPFSLQPRQDFFRRVLQTRAFTVGDFTRPATNRNPTVLFGSPVLDSSGQSQGVVFAEVHPQFMFVFGSKLRSVVPSTATLTEIDQNGNILFPFYISGQLSENALLEKPALVRTILNKRHGFLEEADPKSWPLVYAFTSRHSQLFGRDVTTILGTPRQTLLGRATLARSHYLAWLAIASGVSIALGFGLGWLSSQPLARGHRNT